MRKILAACAVVAALGAGGCVAGPDWGAALPNSYLPPSEGAPTAEITFSTRSDVPDLIGFALDQSRGPWAPTSNRAILFFAGPDGWEGIPPGGSYNTVARSFEAADRSMIFAATEPLYFAIEAKSLGADCTLGFSFTPAANGLYTAHFEGDRERCSVQVVDTATGAVPDSFRVYDPPRR